MVRVSTMQVAIMADVSLFSSVPPWNSRDNVDWATTASFQVISNSSFTSYPAVGWLVALLVTQFVSRLVTWLVGSQNKMPCRKAGGNHYSGLKTQDDNYVSNRMCREPRSTAVRRPCWNRSVAHSNIPTCWDPYPRCFNYSYLQKNLTRK